jgi:probable F420-dependent oxidoreductase
MQIGIHLPNSGPLADQVDLVDLAVRAEGLGFPAVWVHDHLFTPAVIKSTYPRGSGVYENQTEWSYHDALTVLSVVAGATEHISLGTRVLIPVYRNPVVLAKQLSTLDHLSGGRLVLGVGAGWMAEEFEVVGVPLSERYARLTEHVALMRRAWEHGTSEFEGAFYHHAAAGFYPRPRNRIPVLVGGFGERTLRRVAKWGDGWAAVADPKAQDELGDLRERLQLLHQLTESEGRDPGSLVILAAAPVTAPVSHFEGLQDLGVTSVDVVLTQREHLDLKEAVAIRDALNRA